MQSSGWVVHDSQWSLESAIRSKCWCARKTSTLWKRVPPELIMAVR